MANTENSRLIIPWILDALDNNRYPTVLRWFNHDKRIFELQWYHQRRTGWCEKYIKLFEAWARHKGRFTNGQQPKVLKLTFRNALRSKKEQLKKVKPPTGKSKLCQYWQLIEPESDVSSPEDSDTLQPSPESACSKIMDLQMLNPTAPKENEAVSDYAPIDETISISQDTVYGQNNLLTLFPESISEDLLYDVADDSLLFKEILDLDDVEIYDMQTIDEIEETDIPTFLNLSEAKN